MRRLVILGLGSVLFGGCYYTETLIGVLSDDVMLFYEDQPFVVPDSVAVEEAFTAVVYTLGSGCISFNGTRVDVEGNTATITPYDTFKTPGRSTGCETYLTANRHEATIRFRKKGQATVFLRIRETQYRRDVRVLRRTVHVY